MPVVAALAASAALSAKLLDPKVLEADSNPHVTPFIFRGRGARICMEPPGRVA
jgi:hypothetical protein